MFKGFRDFVLRGNVVDLAVGVVIGVAFGTVVTAFVKDLLTPLIAALAGKPDFSAYSLELNGAKFLYGDFLNALISFLLVAAAVYYFVVLPVNALMARYQEAGVARQDEMPAVPERYSHRRPQVRVLHGCRLGRCRLCGPSARLWPGICLVRAVGASEARAPGSARFPCISYRALHRTAEIVHTNC